MKHPRIRANEKLLLPLGLKAKGRGLFLKPAKTQSRCLIKLQMNREEVVGGGGGVIPH